MRAARYYGNRDIRIDDIERPSPGPGDVLVDIDACGICGSDLAEYLYGPRHGDDFLPYTMGHEIGGQIADVGDGVDLEVGTEIVLSPLVACGECWCCDEAKYNLCQNLTVVGAHLQGAYAEQVVAPAENAVPLPDGVTTDQAAVAEPFTVAYRGLQKSPLRSGQSALVVGMGPIGLGLVQLAKAAGADPIYASGHREARRELARECGADVVIDPRETDPVDLIREEMDGGVDVSFEVAGNESALRDAIAAAKPSGHTTIIGVFKGDVEFNPMHLVNQERSVNGSAAYRTGPLSDRDFGAVIRKFAAGELDPDPLVTSRVGLESIADDGFEALADREQGEVKVLVKP